MLETRNAALWNLLFRNLTSAILAACGRGKRLMDLWFRNFTRAILDAFGREKRLNEFAVSKLDQRNSRCVSAQFSFARIAAYGNYCFRNLTRAILVSV